MSYTEAQKKATYKWREKNRDLWNEARKEYNQTYLNKNRDKYRMNATKYYYLHKEMKLFREILLS